MKVLVTGATGLLGRAIMAEFSSGDNKVLGTGHSRGGENIRQIDLLDHAAVTKLVEEFGPDVIIHTAAISDPDQCEAEPEKIRLLNVGVTRLLASLSKRLGCWLLLISSDYVFAGDAPPYKPNSVVDAVNEYGKSKGEAEAAARQEDDGAGVLRVPILYGPVETLEESSVSKVLKCVLDASKECPLDDVHQRYPTYVADVAHVCRKLAERKMQHCGLHGIWHFSAGERYTKYSMALELGAALKLPTDHIKPRKEAARQAARRPLDSRLDCTALKLMGFYRSSKFASNIASVYAQSLPK